MGRSSKTNNVAMQQQGSDKAVAASGEVVPEAVAKAPALDLHHWFPYRFSWIANEVSLCLHRVYHARWGISVPGWRIITVLAEYAPLAAKDVAAETAMDVVQVTRAVEELHKKDLVRRREDLADRRRVSLELTTAGRKLYAEVVPYALQLEDELLRGMSSFERQQLGALLDQVQANAQLLAVQNEYASPPARSLRVRRSGSRKLA